jgi:hypothetical protein
MAYEYLLIFLNPQQILSLSMLWFMVRGLMCCCTPVYHSGQQPTARTVDSSGPSLQNNTFVNELFSLQYRNESAP